MNQRLEEYKVEPQSEKIKEIKAGGFKGVNLRPKSNDMGLCVLAAAKLASKTGEVYYCVSTAYGIKVGPTKDLKNSYDDFGYGYRVDPEGNLYKKRKK